MNFSQLIGPCTTNDFFENYFEKKFLLNQRNQPGYYNVMLSEADLDQFFAQQNLNPGGIMLVKDGIPVPTEKWTMFNERIAGPVKTVIRTAQLFDQFYQGATIIINKAEKTIPKLAAACRAIEQQIKINIQSNIYITPPNARGFTMHYDTHDIFTMQIKGPKTWRIYDSGEELPVSVKPFRKEPVLVTQFDLNAGDLLYMPRGIVHEAFATSVSTIHVNFGFKPQYGFHLLEGLAELAGDNEPFFRRTMPNGLSSEQETQAYQLLFRQKLHELIDKFPIEQLLKQREDKFIANQLIDFNGSLSNALKLEELNLNSVVSRRTNITFNTSSTKDGLKVLFGEHSLIIPKIVDTALFLGDEPFKISDIKGLITNNGKVTLMRRFIETGFFQIDTNN